MNKKKGKITHSSQRKRLRVPQLDSAVVRACIGSSNHKIGMQTRRKNRPVHVHHNGVHIARMAGKQRDTTSADSADKHLPAVAAHNDGGVVGKDSKRSGLQSEGLRINGLVCCERSDRDKVFVQRRKRGTKKENLRKSNTNTTSLQRSP